MASPSRSYLPPRFSGQVIQSPPSGSTSTGAGMSFTPSSVDARSTYGRPIASMDYQSGDGFYGSALRGRQAVPGSSVGAGAGAGAGGGASSSSAGGIKQSSKSTQERTFYDKSVYDEIESSTTYADARAPFFVTDKQAPASARWTQLDSGSSLEDGKDASLARWVTVFGFPPSAVSVVLSYLQQCGDILRHIVAPEGGNWMHVKFQSELQAQRAISRNGKVIARTIMLGVGPCTEKTVTSNDFGGVEQQSSYKSSVAPRTALNSTQRRTNAEIFTTPSRVSKQSSNSILYRTLEYIFNW